MSDENKATKPTSNSDPKSMPSARTLLTASQGLSYLRNMVTAAHSQKTPVGFKFRGHDLCTPPQLLAWLSDIIDIVGRKLQSESWMRGLEASTQHSGGADHDEEVPHRDNDDDDEDEIDEDEEDVDYDE